MHNQQHKRGFNMQKNILSATLVVSLLLIHSAQADTNSQYAITGKVGTLGAGLDLTYHINKKLNARFNLNGASKSADGEEDGVNYTGNLDALTIGGLIDYHPMAGNFRLSAGLYNNQNEINLDATGSNDNAQVGDRSYNLTGATLNTNVGFKSVAPYLGLGWGNAVKTGSKWRFSFDAGVLFQGTPEAKITASGNAIDLATNTAVNLATDTQFQTELATEEQSLNDDLKDFKAYPVISLGVSYRF
jgi:hypothetical protein